ncbi:MAG: hypothetical protein HW398_416 [Acidobacteria bacterium]|nr:hypothetical protein [Acidobacteriota bacterium]
MQNRFVGPILAAALLVYSVGLLAQNPAGTQSRGTNARPDLSGVWILGDPGIDRSPSQFAAAEAAARDIAAGRVPSFAFSTELPPMQPWAVEKYKAARAGRAPHEAGNDELDPINYPYCLPYTFPRIMTAPFAFEIVPTPEQVFMHFESDHMTRRIYLDGRKHLEGWGPTYLGTSYGKWDGDTLVVETDNILDGTHPAAGPGHVAARLRVQRSGDLHAALDRKKTLPAQAGLGHHGSKNLRIPYAGRLFAGHGQRETGRKALRSHPLRKRRSSQCASVCGPILF